MVLDRTVWLVPQSLISFLQAVMRVCSRELEELRGLVGGGMEWGYFMGLGRNGMVSLGNSTVGEERPASMPGNVGYGTMSINHGSYQPSFSQTSSQRGSSGVRSWLHRRHALIRHSCFDNGMDFQL